MNDNRLFVGADRDNVVIPARAIFEEQYERGARCELLPQEFDRADQRVGTPTALAHGLDEDVAGDAFRDAVDQRFELLHIGMAVAVIPEDHGDRSAAA